MRRSLLILGFLFIATACDIEKALNDLINSCSYNQEIYYPGDRHPANPCQVCNDYGYWINRPDGSDCDLFGDGICQDGHCAD